MDERATNEIIELLGVIASNASSGDDTMLTLILSKLESIEKLLIDIYREMPQD